MADPIASDPKNHDIGLRLQALAYAVAGMDFKMITEIIGISRAGIYRLQKKAKERGFDPEISKHLNVNCIADEPRRGRPKKITAEKEAQIVKAIEESDRYGREKAAWMLADDHNISATSMHRILIRNGFRLCKTTKKPGLSEDMKKRRLEFCLRYAD